MAVSTIQNASLASGVPGKANLPTGSVLQVVDATFTAEFSTSSTSYVDTAISLSITPTSATSKILVLARVPVRQVGYNFASIRWLRGATVVSEPNTQFETGVSDVSLDCRMINSYMFLDSPSTTSSITYKAQAACLTATTFVAVPNNNKATIILMEIAA
jgi:hypothetical protein